MVCFLFLTQWVYYIFNLFLFTIFFFYRIFLVLKNLLSFILKRYTYIIAFLSTCLFILSDTHLPHTDYPNAFASFTAGLYSITISTLIFGLIIQGKNKLALFFAILLFDSPSSRNLDFKYFDNIGTN